MKILNRALRKEFAAPGRCELCHRWCKKREGHHLWHRTPEISIRINMISVGSSRPFSCRCHFDIHNGKIPGSRVLAIVALRDKCLSENITEILEWMRRWVKPSTAQLMIALEELSPVAKVIAMRELAEAHGETRLTPPSPAAQ